MREPHLPVAAPRTSIALVILCSGILSWSCLSCGASDDSAPLLDAGPTCTTVDEHLAPLHASVSSGGFEQIAQILDEILDPASLRAIVQLLLDISQDLPPDTPERLTKLMGHPQAKRLIPVLVALLAPLPGDPKHSPPLPPKNKEMEAFSRIASSCLSASVFEMSAEVMRDPRLPPVLQQLLNALDLADELRVALQKSGHDGKSGFVVLIHNLGMSLSAPGFDPAPLVQALVKLAGDDPGVVAALRDLMILLTTDPQGNPLPKRIEQMSEAVGCFMAMDPKLVLPAYWYDVLLSPEVFSALGGTKADTPPWDLAPIIELMNLTAYSADALSRSEAARDALGQLLGLLLRPDLAIQGIPELVGILQSDIVPGAVAMLTDLLEKPCLKPETP